jgi:hypothetical protein
MSAIWYKISKCFRRAPTPSPLQSPVAEMPYDEAVESTAAMIEDWKKKQPSLPDPEVPRSAVGSICCAHYCCSSNFQS